MAATDIIRRLNAISNLVLGIGLADGTQVNLKNSSGVLEIRNEADNAYSVIRAAAPVGDNDVATRSYVDSVEGVTIVDRQHDGTGAAPVNTGTRGHLIVTTAGASGAIGELYFDDGSGSGTATLLPAKDGRLISVTVALTGGTIVLSPNSLYAWDVATTQWVQVSDLGQLSGGKRIIRYAITNAATQDSASDIPANSEIEECRVKITVPYSGGATIEVGKAGGTVNLLQAAGDNNPQVTGIYILDEDVEWGAGAAAVRTTITGAPAAGNGFVIVEHEISDG